MAKYSETLTEHVMAPRNGGVIEDTDLTGHAGSPGRGAFMILFLKVEDDRIAAAKYHTVGCGPTIASGSMLTEMINGKSIAHCRELTVENLIEALDGMPPDKPHCPGVMIGPADAASALAWHHRGSGGRTGAAWIGHYRSLRTVNRRQRDGFQGKSEYDIFFTTEDTEVTEIK